MGAMDRASSSFCLTIAAVSCAFPTAASLGVEQRHLSETAQLVGSRRFGRPAQGDHHGLRQTPGNLFAARKPLARPRRIFVRRPHTQREDRVRVSDRGLEGCPQGVQVLLRQHRPMEVEPQVDQGSKSEWLAAAHREFQKIRVRPFGVFDAPRWPRGHGSAAGRGGIFEAPPDFARLATLEHGEEPLGGDCRDRHGRSSLPSPIDSRPTARQNEGAAQEAE